MNFNIFAFLLASATEGDKYLRLPHDGNCINTHPVTLENNHEPSRVSCQNWCDVMEWCSAFSISDRTCILFLRDVSLEVDERQNEFKCYIKLKQTIEVVLPRTSIQVVDGKAVELRPPQTSQQEAIAAVNVSGINPNQPGISFKAEVEVSSGELIYRYLNSPSRKITLDYHTEAEIIDSLADIKYKPILGSSSSNNSLQVYSYAVIDESDHTQLLSKYTADIEVIGWSPEPRPGSGHVLKQRSTQKAMLAAYL